jgi:hypothetical protein
MSGTISDGKNKAKLSPEFIEMLNESGDVFKLVASALETERAAAAAHAAHAAHAAADATHATAYAAAYAAVLKIKILRYGVKLLEAQGEEGKAEERAKYAKVVEAAAKVLDLIECTACGDFKNPGCNAKNKHRSCPKNTLKSALAKLEEKSNLNLVPVEGEVKDGK